MADKVGQITLVQRTMQSAGIVCYQRRIERECLAGGLAIWEMMNLATRSAPFPLSPPLAAQEIRSSLTYLGCFDYRGFILKLIETPYQFYQSVT